MRLTRLASTTCAILLISASVASAQRTLSLPNESELNRYGLTRAWWAQANINPSRDTVRHMVIDEDVVVVQSSAGLVTTYEAETGRQLWTAQLGHKDDASFPAVTNSDFVMIAVGMNVFAVTKFEGDIAWQLGLPGHPSATPALDDDQLFVPTLDGSIYAFSLRRIGQLYNQGLLPKWNAQAVQWRFFTGKKIPYSPHSDGRVVNFANESNSLFTISTADRGIVFQFRTDKPADAPLTVADEYIYLASADFRLYCIDMQSGGMRWAPFTAGLPIRSQPIVIGERVFVNPVRGGMFTLSTKTGRQKWPWRPGLTKVLAVSERHLFASDRLDNIHLLDVQNEGKPVAILPYRDFKVRVSNQRTDRLFMATSSGMVVCIRDKQLDFPIYHLEPDRRPIMPQLESDEATDDTPEPPSAEIN